MEIRLAQTVPDTEAEGPGTRFAVWVQGCSLRCAECCNPEMLDPKAGFSVSVEALVLQIAGVPEIEGVSVLGGEPFDQPEAVAELCASVCQLGLSLVVFSGYSLEKLIEDETCYRALTASDVLVDGPFVRNKPERLRRWVGSSNQRVHFLSNRYSEKDFEGDNTVEIRLSKGQVVVNGWPGNTDLLAGKS